MLKQNDGNKQVSGLATVGNRIRSGFKLLSGSRRWLLVLAIAAAVLLAFGLWTDWNFISVRASLDALPELNLTQAEPQVAEKIRQLQNDVETNPASAATWGKLAMNLHVHDLKREALPCYEGAAELDPNDFRWPYYCATMLAETGSPQALHWFERSRTLNPNCPPVRILYG